jgi:1-acyl-sn-glycerol-3-phosphate acyltransferase
MLTWLRSALFTGAFFLTTTVMAIVGAPLLLIHSERLVVGYARLWARIVLFLLRALAGIKVEVRGRDNIPQRAALVAAKHQSAFETFALFPVLPSPTLVMKSELRRIPLFGRFTAIAGMIEVDRAKGSTALRDMVHRCREEAMKGRQIVIFPEGTRRPPGAEPAYQPGIALLYKGLDVPTVPVALNSGLYWPRRSFLKYPGSIVIEFLPPVEPGLDSRTFLDRLETAIETASDRLLVEATRARKAPPLPPQAVARLAEIGKG